MKQFVILEWTEDEKIVFLDIPTAFNPSDSLSKQTGRIKFYEHMDVLMGRRRPIYQSDDHNTQTTEKSKNDETPEKYMIHKIHQKTNTSYYVLSLSTHSNLRPLNDETLQLLSAWGDKGDTRYYTSHFR